MNEDETIMHMVVQVLGADGITVTMELGQLIGLQRLLHAEEEQLTGRHPLPFATPPEPEGHDD